MSQYKTLHFLSDVKKERMNTSCLLGVSTV
uniref:Uncharacterized protein n=1 Tax=Anguilla anguilla TaxID=7936 RepID=A0A0E9VZW2_ANGAN